jgi:hypothetical protein
MAARRQNPIDFICGPLHFAPMSNFVFTWHQMLLLRLVSLFIVFGVLVPGFGVLLHSGIRTIVRLSNGTSTQKSLKRDPIIAGLDSAISRGTRFDR